MDYGVPAAPFVRDRDALRHGTDIRAIQDLMGHTSLETIQRYLALCNEQLRGAIKKLPRTW